MSGQNHRPKLKAKAALSSALLPPSSCICLAPKPINPSSARHNQANHAFGHHSPSHHAPQDAPQAAGRHGGSIKEGLPSSPLRHHQHHWVHMRPGATRGRGTYFRSKGNLRGPGARNERRGGCATGRLALCNVWLTGRLERPCWSELGGVVGEVRQAVEGHAMRLAASTSD